MRRLDSDVAPIDPHRWARERAPKFLALGLAALALGVALRWAGFSVVFPTTYSVPRGLYLAVPVASPTGLPREQLVRVCLPAEKVGLGLARGYLAPVGRFDLEALVSGCPAGHALALKRLLARGGETVRVANVGVWVDDLWISPPPQPVDSQGRPMPALAGRILLPPGTVWVDTFHLGSYGSRYFGPVPASAVTHRLWRLL